MFPWGYTLHNWNISSLQLLRNYWNTKLLLIDLYKLLFTSINANNLYLCVCSVPMLILASTEPQKRNLQTSNTFSEKSNAEHQSLCFHKKWKHRIQLISWLENPFLYFACSRLTDSLYWNYSSASTRHTKQGESYWIPIMWF